jgi:hypothetical protein
MDKHIGYLCKNQPRYPQNTDMYTFNTTAIFRLSCLYFHHGHGLIGGLIGVFFTMKALTTYRMKASTREITREANILIIN